MATRSLIGMEKKDGSVEYVYAHWDGSPMTNGVILMRHYKDRDKIAALLRNGWVSALRHNIGRKHDFGNMARDTVQEKKSWTTFYGRDRGDKNVQSVTAFDRQDFLNRSRIHGAEYIYLKPYRYGGWLFAAGPNDVFHLLNFDAIRADVRKRYVPEFVDETIQKINDIEQGIVSV